MIIDLITAKENVGKYYDWKDIPCKHNSCDKCGGKGRKKDGTICIHMISCPCPKCGVRC